MNLIDTAAERAAPNILDTTPENQAPTFRNQSFGAATRCGRFRRTPVRSRT
jgi:hypothetical protein